MYLACEWSAVPTPLTGLRGPAAAVYQNELIINRCICHVISLS